MRIVLLKDSALGRAGAVIEVSDKQGAVLVRTGQARRYDFREKVLKK